VAYTPLATVTQLTATPLNNVVRQYSSAEQANLLTRASRAIETFCQRRLSPFTISESCRAIEVDPEEVWDIYIPVDPTSQMAISRAQAMGASSLVRHFWVREYPPTWQDLWQGSIGSVTIYRSIAGTQTISGNDVATQLQYEQDTGHVRMYYGAYVPQGSTIVATYSGGYNPVPDELVQATILRAAKMAIVALEPEEEGRPALADLDAEIADLLSDYVRDADDI
jgi:hypothetical protein